MANGRGAAAGQPARSLLGEAEGPFQAAGEGKVAGAGTTIPDCQVVAAYGAALQHSTVSAWWERWRRRSGTGDGLVEELRLDAAGAVVHRPPSPSRAGFERWGALMGSSPPLRP